LQLFFRRLLLRRSCFTDFELRVEASVPILSFENGKLTINGMRVPNAEVESIRPNGRMGVAISDHTASLMLTCYSISELSEYFDRLTLKIQSQIPEFSLQATLFLPADIISRSGHVFLVSTLDIDNWAGPWALFDYRRAVKEAMIESGEPDIVLDEGTSSKTADFVFVCTPTSITTPLDIELSRWVQIIARAIQSAQTSLAADIDQDTLVTLFDFPSGVSIACEQYLLYFVQFLRDLGIEAGASIKHEAHHVLFSVTPQDGAQALDQIREALEVYLRLPDSSEFAAQAQAYGDIAVQQLQANIYHLKGQLMVAGAVLQARDAQIEALQISNFTYQQLLATQQQAATLPLLSPKPSGADAEPLVPGVIEVTKYEGKGFTVNFAEILRRLKRRFDQE
jgi:hypothetical protein